MQTFIDSATTTHRPTTVLRWEFVRGRHRISCQVEQVPRKGHRTAFAVSVVPLWTLERAKGEAFDGLSAALGHHAALASTLRATGWTLVAYSA